MRRCACTVIAFSLYVSYSINNCPSGVTEKQKEQDHEEHYNIGGGGEI